MLFFIYNTIFYKPLLNGLAFFVNLFPGHDAGLAIIALTIIVRLILFPFNHKASMAQRKMKEIEPELKKIKEEHKDNPQEQAKKTMEVYKKHGVSPFNSILLLLIQIPIIFALYKVFLLGDKLPLASFYGFISRPAAINFFFLGLINLSQKNIVLAVLTGLTQFIQMQLSVPNSPKDKSNGQGKNREIDFAKTMSFQMKYIMPVFIVLIALRLPSAIALYWTTMNLFAIFHEIIVRKRAAKRL